MRYFVYGLAEPDTGEIRYVGSSSNPRARLSTHLSAAASNAVRQWVAALGEREADPLLVILGEADGDAAASELEAQFISQLARPRLLNALLPLPLRPIRRRVGRPARVLAPTVGGEMLELALQFRGISQNEAGRQLDLAAGMVSRFISGKRLPGRAMCLAIQSMFGVDAREWDRPAKRKAS